MVSAHQVLGLWWRGPSLKQQLLCLFVLSGCSPTFCKVRSAWAGGGLGDTHLSPKEG